MSSTPRSFSWGSVVLPAFLPTFLFSLGEGALIPIIPIVADSLGATLALAGLIAAMLMVGELAGDIPSGWVVSRIGERNAMIGGALLSIVGVLIALGASEPWMLGVGIFLVGLATAVFALARHAFMTSFVPLSHRARALSTLGGIFRGGWFVGPFIAAGVVHLTGSSQAVFWVHVIACLAAVAVLLVLPDPQKSFGQARGQHEVRSAGEKDAAARTEGLFRTLWSHRGVLVRMGTGAALLSALRASRTVILPLWAVSIGITAPDTALIIGIAGAIDFALFYVSGQIMDRFGRMWSAVPPMIGLGIGHLVLSLSHDLPDAATWFIVVAMFLALANGLSSGVIMTLGADLAPRGDPAPFLGAYRFTGDAGAAAAPLAIAGITAVFSLPVAAAAMGVLALAGAGVLGRYIPRYIPRRPHRPPTA